MGEERKKVGVVCKTGGETITLAIKSKIDLSFLAFEEF